MFNIYGKEKNEDQYKMLNVNQGEFVTRKIHATLISTWQEAEKICYELEKENPNFFFESRKC